MVMMDRDYLFRAMASFLAECGIKHCIAQSRELLKDKIIYCDELVDPEDFNVPATHISLTRKGMGESKMARRSNAPFERNLQSTIIKKLNEHPATLVRCRSADAAGHVAGDADIYGCIDGTHVEIEVKVPGEKPTKLQLERLHNWFFVCAYATWVDSVEEALEFQQEVLAQGGQNNLLGSRKIFE